MPILTVLQGASRTSIAYDTPQPLSTLFARHGVRVDMPCGGRQTCRKCIVAVAGEVSPPGEKELSWLSAGEREAGLRYACMTEARGDVTVTLPDTAVTDEILIAGRMPSFPLQPWGKGIADPPEESPRICGDFFVSPPVCAFTQGAHADKSTVPARRRTNTSRMPSILEHGNCSFTVPKMKNDGNSFEFGAEPQTPSIEKMVGAEKDCKDGAIFKRIGYTGAAVDVGTTTVVLYLYDLATGRLLATASEPNPQAMFGADVITRIGKALHGEGGALARAIRDCIARLLATAAESVGLASDASFAFTSATDTAVFIPSFVPDAMVITGNTAMLYLLTGRSPASIAAAPFDADTLFGGFTDLPFAHKVYLPRCMSAYVGADITTAALAVEFDKPGGCDLLVDIGTNGEMLLRAGDTLLACSTAAGPAFEGAGISCGMPARRGAISKVADDLSFTVLGGGGADTAVGLCGTGILDAVAALRKAGLIDDTGRLEEPFTFPGTHVSVTPADVRAVQLAKAAVCAGILTLIGEAGLTPADIGTLYIAGGFGSFIDVRSAETIGLIPPGFAAKAVAVGNTAGAGASMVLLSSERRAAAEKLAVASRTVELSSSAAFMDAYVDQMMFPEWE